MALDSISEFVGSGTYFGMILVFFTSLPTKDTPRGIITPPYTLFSLYSSLSTVVTSKFVFKLYGDKTNPVAPNLFL